MEFEQLMKRYKKVRDDLGVTKARMVSFDKIISQLPPALKEMSEKDIISLCEKRLGELEQISAEAKDLFGRIEVLKSTYGL